MVVVDVNENNVVVAVEAGVVVVDDDVGVGYVAAVVAFWDYLDDMLNWHSLHSHRSFHHLLPFPYHYHHLLSIRLSYDQDCDRYDYECVVAFWEIAD